MDEALRLFIGTGVEGLRPPGYRTIDINPANAPDIVADASSLPMIADGAAEELHASHVLEHFSWPRALLVLEEWARVLRLGGTLKLAVPDMEIYAHFLLGGHNPFCVMGDIYGGHWATEGGPQGHHFGYTRRMLVEALTVVGFADFDVWRSDMPEAANAWVYGENGERIGVSLNLSGVKQRGPLLDLKALAHHIRHHDIRESFMVVVRNRLADAGQPTGIPDIDATLFQKLNFRFLEATHLAEHFRREAEQLRQVPAAPAHPRPVGWPLLHRLRDRLMAARPEAT